MSDEISIEDLDKASVIKSEDELVVQQDGTTKTVTLELIDNLLTYVKQISQTITSPSDAGINEITVTLSDGRSILLHTRNGSRGNSIVEVKQTEESLESEGINKVEVSLTDGEKFSFNTRNGKTGNGITNITQTKESHEDGGENELVINMTDGSSYTIAFRNGEKGDQGESGVNVVAGSFFNLAVDSATGDMYVIFNDEVATEEDVPIEIDEDGNVYFTVKDGE